jgi:mannose-6-phosphate isomerase
LFARKAEASCILGDMETVPPFRLAPYFRTRPWGFQDLNPWYNYKAEGEPIGEVWLTGEMCTADTGDLQGMSLAEITRQHRMTLLGPSLAGQDFPLLVKLLFPKEKLSVQVHPDDALAQHYGEPRGKTECWYALDAKPGARVALGVKPGVTLDQVRVGVADHTLESLLTLVPVEKGDMVFVDAGTVHAVWPGLVILETQQTSDLTYRMYDYGSPRELHLEKSFAAMHLVTRAGKVAPKSVDGHSVLIDERYFRIERWPIRPGTAPSLVAPVRVVQLLFVVEGRVRISGLTPEGKPFEPFGVERNQMAVIPASTARWSLSADGPVEIIRILPAGE